MAERQIDLNSDLGEGFGPWAMGDDETMLSIVTSANVACGGHAGDTETMFRTMAIAAANDVVVGAHPGYLDREGFGRRIIPMSPAEIGRMVAAQVGSLRGVAALVPVAVRYVKPHGALGNLAARDRGVADAIVDAVGCLDSDLALLAISGTELESAAVSAGSTVFSEIFADRGYLASGQLVPRDRPGALITDPAAACERLSGFLETGRMPVIDGEPILLDVDSVCVHGDSAGAVAMARLIRDELVGSGVRVTGFAASVP